MGRSLDTKAKEEKLKALQALVDALGEESSNKDGVVPILGISGELLRNFEQLEREGYAEKTTRWATLMQQNIPGYIITERGAHYYNQIMDSIPS